MLKTTYALGTRSKLNDNIQRAVDDNNNFGSQCQCYAGSCENRLQKLTLAGSRVAQILILILAPFVVQEVSHVARSVLASHGTKVSLQERRVDAKLAAYQH